jgi:cytoskeletal protein RodZ
MAGNPVRSAPRGVGSALRRARELRGVPLEAAARDTKLPVERLRALEEEAFDDLPGEVYVRATLRTYAGYLGLSGDKVLAAYGRQAEEPPPPPPPAKMGAVERALAAARVRDSQRFFLIAAAIVLAALVAVGLVSREGAPAVAELERETPSVSPIPEDAETFTLVLAASRPVEVTVTADGATQRATLDEDESVSFSAVARIQVEVADGGAVTATLAGHEVDVPDLDNVPWRATFTAATVERLGGPVGAGPSATATASASPDAEGSPA